MGWWPGKNVFGKEARQRRQDRRERRHDRRDVQQEILTQDRYGQDPNNPMGNQFGGLYQQGGSGFGNARNAQMDAYQQYANLASGQGPSLAQQQLAAQSQQNVTNQMAMAAQARGGNLSAQANQAAAAGAANQMATDQQMAQLRAQEQLSAMQGMSGMANTMADQSLQQQMGGANLASNYALGQRGLDQSQGQMLMEQQQNNRKLGTDIVGGVTQAAGSIAGVAMLSDIRAKRDISMGGAAAGDALLKGGASTWRYKDGMGPAGLHAGPMAQGLERTEIGRRAVIDTPQGKAIDGPRLSALTAAATGDQEARLRGLEEALGRSEAGSAMTDREARLSDYENPLKSGRNGHPKLDTRRADVDDEERRRRENQLEWLSRGMGRASSALRGR